jgi:hypothetical protein
VKRTTSKRTLAAAYCVLLLAVLLLVTACGGGYSSPGSSPTPGATKGGYSIVIPFNREIEFLSNVLQTLAAP